MRNVIYVLMGAFALITLTGIGVAQGFDPGAMPGVDISTIDPLSMGPSQIVENDDQFTHEMQVTMSSKTKHITAYTIITQYGPYPIETKHEQEISCSFDIDAAGIITNGRIFAPAVCASYEGSESVLGDNTQMWGMDLTFTGQNRNIQFDGRFSTCKFGEQIGQGPAFYGTGTITYYATQGLIVTLNDRRYIMNCGTDPFTF